jgi:hypothetical protein
VVVLLLLLTEKGGGGPFSLPGTGMPGITLTCDYLNSAHTDGDDEVVPGKVVLNCVVWSTWRPPGGEWMVVRLVASHLLNH